MSRLLKEKMFNGQLKMKVISSHIYKKVKWRPSQMEVECGQQELLLGLVTLHLDQD